MLFVCRFLQVAVVLSALSALSILVVPTQGQSRGKLYVADELLVKLKPSGSKLSVADRASRAELAMLETLGDLGWIRVKLTSGEDPRSAAASVLKNAEIEAAQPNYYYHLDAIPNDPQWSSSSLYGLRIISAPQAWDLTTGSPSVVVANIDTGMRYTHEDLTANMWTNPGEIPGNGVDDDGNGFADDYYGYDFFYNDPDPLDEHGHGTHTGGTIGAVGNNLLGVAGVNWTVKIMAIKIYSASTLGTTSAMLVNAYNYVRMMKNRGINVRATNNSYSGCNEACGPDFATKDALDALGNTGVLNVFAAGNNAQNNDTSATPNLPASYNLPTIISVASSTASDSLSSFSAYGPTSVDLAAPGTAVLSTTNASNSSYGILSGTSMATPHVTGAIALLAAYNPSLSAASIKATLLNSVDVLPAFSGLVRSGGRLNVFRALQNQTVCSYSLSSTNINTRLRGGFYTLSMLTSPNCDYSMTRNVKWVSFEPDVGSGSGTITIQVRLYPLFSRSGTLNIGGQTVTVTQSRF